MYIQLFMSFRIIQGPDSRSDVQEVQSSSRYSEMWKLYYLVALLDCFFSRVENYDNLDSRALFALQGGSKVIQSVQPKWGQVRTQFSIFKITYRISTNSFRGNYSFLNLALCTVTFAHST